MEWVEVRGRTIDQAVEVALAELGVERAEAEIEVVQEPERGFLGIGGRDAVVRVKRAPKRSRRRRRGSRGQRKGAEREGSSRRAPEQSSGQKGKKGRTKGQQSAERRQGEPRRAPAPTAPVAAVPRDGGENGEDEVDIEEQRRVVHEFLEGLVQAFGLEGRVESETGEDFIAVRIVGEQTEALIGPKGVVMQSILELTRTVVQRKTQSGARIRLDIAGYMERRREALRIYAARLAEQAIEEGGEIMLEPMNAADRKVVHDVVAETEGVRSFSEGEEPERSVVIARDD